MPIIVLSAVEERSMAKSHIMLRLEYGLIVENLVRSGESPAYYLFCRNDRRIVKTNDVEVLLDELGKLPDGATVDMVSKCTVPFYTQHGANIDAEYDSIMELLRRKRFKLVSSLDDDEKHASFCYCESSYKILEKYTPILR